jgi:hypothetical protein
MLEIACAGRRHPLLCRHNRIGHRGGIMNKSFAFALASLVLAQAPECLAQEQQSSFKSLMGRGFDIKSVTFARGEATENRETFIVTLQSGKSVAVCFFSANAWISLSNNVLDDPKRCDVR